MRLGKARCDGFEAEDELGLKGKSESLPVTVAYVLFAGQGGMSRIFRDASLVMSDWDLILPLASLVVALAALIGGRGVPAAQSESPAAGGTRLWTMMTRMGGPRSGRDSNRW